MRTNSAWPIVSDTDNSYDCSRPALSAPETSCLPSSDSQHSQGGKVGGIYSLRPSCLGSFGQQASLAVLGLGLNGYCRQEMLVLLGRKQMLLMLP